LTSVPQQMSCVSEVAHAEADFVDADLLASVHSSDPCACLLCKPDPHSKHLHVLNSVHRARQSAVSLETQQFGYDRLHTFYNTDRFFLRLFLAYPVCDQPVDVVLPLLACHEQDQSLANCDDDGWLWGEVEHAHPSCVFGVQSENCYRGQKAALRLVVQHFVIQHAGAEENDGPLQFILTCSPRSLVETGRLSPSHIALLS
jgi:hypothetical protein